MRQLYLSLLVVIYVTSAFGQTPQEDRMNFEPSELIIKLKDEVNAKLKYSSAGKTTSSLDLKAFLDMDADFEKVSVMFSEKSIKNSLENKKKMMQKAAMKKSANPNNGSITEPPVSLKNIFKVKLKNTQDPSQVLRLIEDVKQNPDVEFAEPNYRFSINDFTIDSEILSEEDLKNIKKEEEASSSLVPNDALYGKQTNISQVNIDKVWESGTTGDGSQVIAILDTGVDYNHPDLKDNIWINEAELNGIEGFDDDGNGYVDDIYGWDFINIDSEPLDDNMHGTHVAGIAGAVGNNELGIAGAAWNVKLMPIKVFQSSGVGDATTIAEGIEYAANNGATVINMSFGSYAESMTMKAALENAYATSVLVASAGNNGVAIGPCLGCAPLFPAAYTFVLGVEDVAGYSNYDQDGPVYSLYPNFLLNYELKAPGTGILSTVPDGGYRNLTGTSMSAPLIAGGIALYLQNKPEDSKELIFGNLINTSNTYVDFEEAMNAVPIPDIKIISAAISDTLSGNIYQDFQPDSGETINLYPTIKNYWGQSNGVKISLEIGGNEFQNEYYNSIITITEPETMTGSVSAYATYKQLVDPLEFKVAEDVAHNTQIEFILKAWDQDNPSQVHSIDFTLKIKNSIKLQGLIENDTVLYADKEYLIDNTVILKHAYLIIKPGAVIKFGENEVLGTKGQIQLYTESFTDPETGEAYNKESKILALGTKDSLITFKRDVYYNGYAELNGYSLGGANGSTPNGLDGILGLDLNSIPVKLENGTILAGSICNYCDFKEGIIARNINLMNSKFQYSSFADAGQGPSLFAYRNNLTDYANRSFYNSYPMSYGYGYVGMYYNNIANLHSVNDWNNTTAFGMQWYSQYQQGNNYFNMSKILWTFINGEGYNSGLWEPVGFQAPSYSGFTEFEGVWIGAGTVEKLKELNVDAFDGSNGVWEYSNPRLTPYEEAHGIVWKVLVNGINSFDNYDSMINNPVGVGSHELKVYFNREMDTLVDPLISYGVTQPFTQNIINEKGSWSADGKIYTVNHQVKIGTGTSDGLNRIRVTQAKDALDGWKIPKEDLRFNILIQSAGSLSSGFFATPGLGKIELDWEEPTEEELNDVLGYNMFRYQIDAEGNETETMKLNESLITTSEFADFEVTEGETYFYKYKILRTSLEETDFSQTISTQPLTSELGDSNGDFGVNVMDVIQNVDYILGHNPKPFIFQAADVNNDGSINVLDVVGVVDIILNPNGKTGTNATTGEINYYPSEPVGKAVLSWEGDDLYIESEHQIGGLQLSVSSDFNYTVNERLSNLERLNYEQDGNEVLMLYSFNNISFGEGKVKLLTRSDAAQEMEFVSAVVSTVSGAKLEATFEEGTLSIIEAPEQLDTMDFGKLYPNPSNGLLNVEYYLPGQVETVSLSIYNLQGQLVFSDENLRNVSGMNTHRLNLGTISGGVYVVVLNAMNNGRIAHRQFKKLVIE